MARQTFYIEVTDTFGGELNYGWLSRYRVEATTERGAFRVIGKEYGLPFRFDGCRWDAVGCCIAGYALDEPPVTEDICRYVKLN